MSGKYMKVRRIIIPTITMVILASQLFGCAAVSKEEGYNLLQENTEIELEIAELDTVDQDAIASLEWTELGSLTTYESLRAEWDSILGITGTTGDKSGIFYVGYEGPTQDNYLAQVISLRDFVEFTLDDDNYNALVDAVRNNFADSDELTDAQLFSIGLNAYFNLLPMKDEAESYANDYVSRAQFLSLITRATNPSRAQEVDDFKNNLDELETAVGDSIYNESVALSLDYSYLTTEDGSLNANTYNTSISRGEAIYTIMQMLYGEAELAAVDIDSVTFTDTTNGGDIASENNLSSNSQVIQFALQNPDKGCPEEIYRALVKTYELGLISDETQWDEAITLSDAVSIYYNVAVSKLNDTTNSSSTTTSSNKITDSNGWDDYKETMEVYVEKGIFNQTLAHNMNPDIYGTETAGKATGDIPMGIGDPSMSQYIKCLELTTTKGYYIEAYWYTETNAVQFVYSGEISPAGCWITDWDSDTVLGQINTNILSVTHQQKIDALGEPSMSAEEVIAALSDN